MALVNRTPTGRQYEITAGPHRAVVTEVGATLRLYEWQGRPVLAGFGAESRSTAGRGQVLAPWPNRIRGGRYEFDGRTHQLPIDEPTRQNAIHGLVRWSPWILVDHDVGSVTLTHTLYPRDGYPFLLELIVTYSLDDHTGLAISMSAHNAGAETCPFACGAHPYLVAGTGPVDDWRLELRADTRLITDDQSIPVGSEAVESTPFDFRYARLVGSTVLDTCFTDLHRDLDEGTNKARAVLTGNGSGAPMVTVWMDDAFPYVMVFSADPLDGPERRAALAIEPMTAAPDAFRSGAGLIRLQPGETWTGSWGITPA